MTAALDFDRLDTYVAEGRLIRGAWTGTDEQGRETACLMAALYPPVGESRSANVCPASLMRAWLAQLSVWIDDNGTPEKWPQHIRRYAAVIRDVVALDADADSRLARKIGALIVREAVSHVTTDEWGVRVACETVAAALESGDSDPIAAAQAAWAAAWATEAATEAATWAARASTWAATAATWAATAAAWAAAEAEDRLIDGMLTAMEEAVRR